MAVAFLMLFISSCLPDTDHRDDDADNRHYNTDKLQNHSEHRQRLPFTLFSIFYHSDKVLQDVTTNILYFK